MELPWLTFKLLPFFLSFWYFSLEALVCVKREIYIIIRKNEWLRRRVEKVLNLLLESEIVVGMAWFEATNEKALKDFEVSPTHLSIHILSFVRYFCFILFLFIILLNISRENQFHESWNTITHLLGSSDFWECINNNPKKKMLKDWCKNHELTLFL